MNPRRQFTPAFKARVVWEVLSGTQSPTQACRAYGLKDSVLSRWKQRFIERVPQIFEQATAHDSCQARVAELERLLGQLTLELEISKKASLLWASRRDRNGSW